MSILILISNLRLVFQLVSFPQVSPPKPCMYCTYPDVTDDVGSLTSHLTLINIFIWCSNWRKDQIDFVCTLCFDEAQGPQVRARDYSCASLYMMQGLLVQNPGYDYDKVEMYRYLMSYHPGDSQTRRHLVHRKIHVANLCVPTIEGRVCSCCFFINLYFVFTYKRKKKGKGLPQQAWICPVGSE